MSIASIRRRPPHTRRGAPPCVRRGTTGRRSSFSHIPIPLSRLAACAAAGLALLVVGCSSRPGLNAAYAGPEITLEPLDDRWVAILQAPTPGWNPDIDASYPVLGGQRVLLTLREPDFTLLYPQVVTEQRIATNVPTHSAIEIVARVVPHNIRESKTSYGLAASAPGNPESPAAPAPDAPPPPQP